MASTRWKKWLLWLLLLLPVCYATVVYWRIVQQSGRDKARLDQAAQLYHHGLAPMVIITGGSGGDPRFSEGVVGREYLKTLGIPDSQLIAETQSDDTAESARRVSTIMYVNSMHSCLAVSDGYHIFRIKQMLAREGITAYGAPRPNSRPQSFWRRQESAWHEIGSYTLWLFHLT